MDYIKKYYPEIINMDNLYERLYIYDLIYFLKQYVSAPQYLDLKDNVISACKKLIK